MDESTCQECGGAVSVVSAHPLCSACLAIKGINDDTLERRGRERETWTAPAIGEVTQQFPELDGIAPLGRGGMGAVYRARQKQLDRTVALKILPTQLMRDATFTGRFAREAQALAKLNHPHIVTVYDFGRRGELFFFLMEYVDGPTLRQIITTRQTQPEQAMSIIRQVCDALQFAHDSGIVHRDIKPENILLNSRGQVKIADFGLAKLMAADSTAVPIFATSSAVGTPLYMAPEQVKSPQAVDARADVYSTGVVLYELLTGKPPSDALRAPSETMDGALSELISRALNPDCNLRLPSVAAFQTMLGAIPTGALKAIPTPLLSAPSPKEAAQPRPSIQKRTVREVREAISVPARGIRYVAIANIGFLLLTTIPALLSYIWAAPEKVIDNPLGLHLSLPWWATGAFLFTMLSVLINGLVVLGANRMRELRGYGWSWAASILCLFAAPGNVVGAVFGVWAIVILARTQTRQAFGVSRLQFHLRKPLPGGVAAWMPMARICHGKRAPDLANYVLLASTLWLVSYALVSEYLLGKPLSWYSAILLTLPAVALPQSMFRAQSRKSVEDLDASRTESLKPVPLAARIAAFAAALLLFATTSQSLTIRQIAERRATTQPTKPSLADRLHVMLPKVRM